MASLFSAILPDHLKEKLGMRTSKERDKSGLNSPARKPLATNNTTQPRLSTELRSQVQSPGFTSRLSSLAKRENDIERRNLSPRYSMVGNLPKVALRNQALPKLDSKRRVSRGSPNVTVRLAPSDPFSPFKRRLSSETQPRERISVEDDKRNISTDPRSVIAVLAELSKKRKTLNDDQSETGSKRARRDSSSSIGSSLSMEMPPLFSSGVVGQTTSHLVNREADLSLGSLLSRNQSMFGHSNTGMGASNITISTMSSMPSSISMAGVHNPALMGQAGVRHNSGKDSTTAMAAGAAAGRNVPPGTRGVPALNRAGNIMGRSASVGDNNIPKRLKSSGSDNVRTELLASLSSSRCMLQKRKRDNSDGEDSDESEYNFDTPKPKRPNNSFRLGDIFASSGSKQQSRDSSRGSSRHSSDGGSPTAGGETPLSRSKDRSSSTPAKDVGPVLVLPSPADMIRPLSKAKNNKARMVTKEDLDKEKSLQKKRLDKLLKAFDDDNKTTTASADESKETSSSQSIPSIVTTTASTTTTPAGGFAFSLGSPLTSQAQNAAPGFTHDLNKKADDKKDKENTTEKKEDKKDETKASEGKKDNAEVAKVKPTVTFSFGSDSSKEKSAGGSENSSQDSAAPPPYTFKSPTSGILKPTSDSNTSALPAYGAASSLTVTDSAATSKPLSSNLPDIAQVSSAATFSFGKTTSAATTDINSLAVITTTASSAAAPPPVFSFGSSLGAPTASKPAATTQQSTAPTFSFGTTASSGETKKTVTSLAAPAFSFGATTAVLSTTVAATAGQTATFTFGAAATKTTSTATSTAGISSPAAFSFGAATTKSSSTTGFSFGAPSNTTTSSQKPPTTAAATAAQSFSFGVAANTTSSSTAAAPAATGLFSFGGAAAATKTTNSSVAPSFSFGSNNTQPAATEKSKDTFAFGAAAAASVAPSTSSAAPSFSFGAASSSSATAGGGAANSNSGLFSFGKTPAAKDPAAKSGAFSFGAAPAANTTNTAAGDNKSSGLFSFGGAAADKPAQPSFGATAPTTTANTAFTFGSSSAAPASSAFGGAASSTFGNSQPFGGSSTASNNSNAGAFTFGASNTQNQASKPPVAAAASPFSFGGSAASTPQQPSAAAGSNNGLFAFGGSAPSSQTANNSQAAASPFSFGGGGAASSQPGAAPSAAGAFSFGAAAPQPAAAKTGFNFGQPATGQSQQPAAGGSGMFNFGGSSTTATPAFGATSPPAFGATSPFGAAPQAAVASPFGTPQAATFGSPPAGQTPGGGSMFSIGAGSTQTRPGQQPRKYATARRTRK